MIGLTSITFRKLTCEEIIRLAQESRAECICLLYTSPSPRD